MEARASSTGLAVTVVTLRRPKTGLQWAKKPISTVGTELPHRCVI